MKSKFWILLFAVLLLLCIGISIPIFMGNESAFSAQIISDGQIVKTVLLSQEQEFTVTSPQGGSNTVTVRDGKIAVTQADCPDHYCMLRGFCGGGTEIVCLPNKLIIRFLGEQEIDAIVG